MPLHTAAPLTADQEAALGRLKGFPTRYEVVVRHPDGRERLIVYTPRKSLRGLFDTLTKEKTVATLRFLGTSDDWVSYSREKGKIAIRVEGGGLIQFSGRTQRDAVLAGELPFILDDQG